MTRAAASLTLTVPLLIAGCTRTSADTSDAGETGAEDSDSADGSSGSGEDSGDGPAITSATVSIPDNCGLTAVVEVVTDVDADVRVEFEDSNGLDVTTASSSGTDHRVFVTGLHAEQSYNLAVVATAPDTGATSSEVVAVSTGPLPADTPTPVVSQSDPDLALDTFGHTLVGPVLRDGEAAQVADVPVVVSLDPTGEVDWWFTDPEVSNTYVARSFSKLDDQRFVLRTPGEIRVLNPACEVVASYVSEIPGWNLHHDVIELPSGNILALAREIQQVDVAFLGGNVNLQGDTLIEWNPAGEVVWTWSSFDHLDTQRFPGNLSQTPKGPPNNIYYDWTHGNGIWYDAGDDAILLSLRHQNWILKVDHQTGDVLWTLGDEGDFSLAGAGAEWFYSQHMPSLLPDGTVLLYDNGNERPGMAQYSRAVRFDVDAESMTATQLWSYQTPAYTPFLGGAERLESGHILVSAGGQRDDTVPASMIEVDPDDANAVIWQVDYPASYFYRARRASNLAGETRAP